MFICTFDEKTANELNKQFGKQATKVSDYIILIGKKQTEPIYEGIKEQE